MRIALETRKKALTKKTINILNKFKEESRSGVNSKVSSILNFGRAGLFSIDSASLRGSLVFARGYFQEASLMYSQNLGLQASVKGIPLNIDILHSDYPSYGDMRTLSNGFRYSFSFDHERYMMDWQRKLDSVFMCV